MPNALIVNYDDLNLFVKQFRDEGEDIVQLCSDTRQRILFLHNEWDGKAADAFYKEMASDLLPALQRVSYALFFCNEILIKIMKIMHNADEETALYFDKDFGVDLGSGSGIQRGPVDAPVTVAPAIQEPAPAEIPPVPEPEKPKPDALVTAQEGGGASGGGNAGESTRGIQGNLKDLGSGVSDHSAPSKAADTNSDVKITPENTADSVRATGGETSKPMDAAGSPNSSTPSQLFNGTNTAVAGAGAAGAAAVGAAVLKDVKKTEN